MSKGIILSAVIAIIALPIIASREKNPKVGLKKALWYTIIFNIAYLLALRFVVHM
jgi:hypothetical protein